MGTDELLSYGQKEKRTCGRTIERTKTSKSSQFIFKEIWKRAFSRVFTCYFNVLFILNLKMVILIEVVTESVWTFYFFFLYSGGLSDVPCEERFVFVFVRKLSCYRKQLKIRSPLANYSEFRASFRSKDGDPKAFFRSKDGNPGSSFRSQEKYNLESRPLSK